MSKAQHEAARLMVLGVISELEPVDRAQAEAAADEIRAVLKARGEAALLGLALVGCEVNAEDDE